MTDSTGLERRYRRLLRFYPRAFRREHEDEMLAVLMAGAVIGQRWSGPTESANLLSNAIWMRLRQVKLPSSREYGHATLWFLVRVLSGMWLIALTGILCQYGSWWGLTLLAPAALHFDLAYRLGCAIQK
jgi:hypothetical protein